MYRVSTGDLRAQKRPQILELQILRSKLELQMVVSHCTGAGNGTWLITEPPLQPPNLETIGALSLELCLPVKSDGTMGHICAGVAH